jgi:hypothetical protein
MVTMLDLIGGPAGDALAATLRYGTPDRWLMHPAVVDCLAVHHGIVDFQNKYAQCSIDDKDARDHQPKPVFLGLPVEIDWLEPCGIPAVSMEVITLRSLWDKLP